AAVGSDDAPPAAFRKSKAATDGGKHPDEVFSTATTLIDAAREAGALEALAAEARAAAGEKVENAQALHLLIELASGRGQAVRPQIEARLQEVMKHAEAQPDPSTTVRRGGGSAPRPFPWTDYLLAQTALDQGDPAIRGLGLRLLEALLKPAQRLQDQA